MCSTTSKTKKTIWRLFRQKRRGSRESRGGWCPLFFCSIFNRNEDGARGARSSKLLRFMCTFSDNAGEEQCDDTQVNTETQACASDMYGTIIAWRVNSYPCICSLTYLHVFLPHCREDRHRPSWSATSPTLQSQGMDEYRLDRYT